MLQVVGVILQLHTWRLCSEAIVGVTLKSPLRFHLGGSLRVSRIFFKGSMG